MTSSPAAERASHAASGRPLVEVEDLKVWFPITEGLIFERHVGDVRAVDGISFTLRRGETLGLVGESGCGKSTTGRALVRLYKPTAGKITFEGVDLGSLEGSDLRRVRRRMQMIFQDPYSSLDPRMTAGGIVLDRHVGDIRAVDDVSLQIKRGETVGLVGESGCGKSTVGRTIARPVVLLPQPDSPTRPSVSPRRIVIDTSSTARTSPTWRSSTTPLLIGK